MTFTIPGQLPGMNEIIAAANKHRMQYYDLKKTEEYFIGLEIKKAKLKPIQSQVDIKFTWLCANKKRDKDNITAGQKFIIDALKDTGIIKNDGWKYIRDITHRVDLDRKNPRIEVELTEVQK